MSTRRPAPAPEDACAGRLDRVLRIGADAQRAASVDAPFKKFGQEEQYNADADILALGLDLKTGLGERVIDADTTTIAPLQRMCTYRLKRSNSVGKGTYGAEFPDGTGSGLAIINSKTMYRNVYHRFLETLRNTALTVEQREMELSKIDVYYEIPHDKERGYETTYTHGVMTWFERMAQRRKEEDDLMQRKSFSNFWLFYKRAAVGPAAGNYLCLGRFDVVKVTYLREVRRWYVLLKVRSPMGTLPKIAYTSFDQAEARDAAAELAP